MIETKVVIFQTMYDLKHKCFKLSLAISFDYFFNITAEDMKLNDEIKVMRI